MRWILAMLLSAGIASAQDLRAPTLAAASNFGQGVPRGLMQAAIAAGITDFRDAVYWDLVEGEDGRFRYGPARTRYPDRIGQLGTGMSLTVNNGHALYEDGATPLGAEAIAAFGRHAAQVATRFPAIHSIEIGNEFNSANFVSGPLRDQGLAARARAYAALHDSVARQVRAARPEVRIIGAGVHSIPTGYLTLLSDTGIFARMDALAFHPYDTPVTLLDRQVALMRQVPGLAAMPLEITEFGTTEMDAAPGHLMRMMCKAALSGVTRLAWYPLHPRGDGFAPLLTRAGDQTPAGRAYALAQRRLTGQPVADVSPDAATPACLFGPDVTMVWGLPAP
ncbi:hypothetical protein [Jannaschia sp. M317]|uniref:hypothetical protein n=1 Tax=Jannaschia sp. M317 TaxID=2867011 RepID=UPI0021A38792|nr:hypothetical protein [Jannaschia sp. M317]UWQ19941.1 hypothetical protein K3551_19540 [Jannaschia sp. M317]